MARRDPFLAALNPNPERWQAQVQNVDGWSIATDGSRAHCKRPADPGPESSYAWALRTVALAVEPKHVAEISAEDLSDAVGLAKALGLRWDLAWDIGLGTVHAFHVAKKITMRDDERLDEVLGGMTLQTVFDAVPGLPAFNVRFLADAVRFTGSHVIRYSGLLDPSRFDSSDGCRRAVLMPMRV